MWFLPPAIAKVFSRMPAAAQSIAQAMNPTLDSAAAVNDPSRMSIVVGTVIRTGPGWYDMTVNVPSVGCLGCVMLSGAGCGGAGVNECSLPQEGARVLVYRPGNSARYGVVLGVLPQSAQAAATDRARANPGSGYGNFLDLESGSTCATEDAYAKPMEDKKNTGKVNAGSGRPLDLLPGMYALVNDQGVGVSVSPLAAQLKGSSRASVRVSPVDDQVRINSGFFQHFNAQGLLQTFNDGGYITEERGVAMYQHERSGTAKIGTALFKAGPEKTLKAGSLQSSVEATKPQTVPKRRLQTFMGYLGDIFSMFVAKPDKDLSPETADNEPKDQGLTQFHVDSSGRVILRSAAGILFQRWDCIPVPKRLKQPWDPEGDKVEDDPDPELKKEPFKFDEAHPYGRSLQWRDANAWRVMCAYWRMYLQSKGNGKKDFFLPEESECKDLEDSYDDTGKGKEDYAKNLNRQASIGIEEDGSIILRDAWGSEICMRGGNIVVTCAGQLELRSGKSTVMLAGHDAVIKARQSVDVIATEKDVRIKAENNLHMLAEARKGSGGSVFIESTAKSPGPATAFDGKKGEDVRAGGIIFKAKDAGVFMQGQDVHLSGSRRLMLETFDESGSNQGMIEIASAMILANAKNQMLLTAANTAGMFLTSSQFMAAAPSVVVAGSSKPLLCGGGQIAVPQWVDVADVYDKVKTPVEKVADILQKEEWLMPFKPSDRKSMHFTYRTSEQCGTMSASELDGKTFAVYQPFWAILARAGAKTVKKSPEPWAETEVEETKSWPGKEAWDQAYVTLPKEINVDPATGKAKAMKEVIKDGVALTPKSFDEYEVMPHS